MALNLVYPTPLNGAVVIGDTTTFNNGSNDVPPQLTTAVNLAGKTVPIKAILELQSEDGAFVVPRMTSVDRILMDPIVDGALVFDTDLAILMLYEGGAWLEIATGPAVQFFNWNEVVGPTLMLPDNGYWVTNAALTNMTLPVICPKDAIIKVSRQGAGNFSVRQNAGQQIQYENLSTTLGVAGHIDSQEIGDVLTMVCRVANTLFVVEASVGNYDVV